MLGVIDHHKQITAHSKRYIKFSHYIFGALSALPIHRICKLFTICSLRTSKIHFNYQPSSHGLQIFVICPRMRHAPSF